MQLPNDPRLYELIQNDATAYRLYSIASCQNWTVEKFLLELAMIMAAENKRMDDALLRVSQNCALPAHLVESGDGPSFASAKMDAELYGRQYVVPLRQFDLTPP